MQYHYAKVGSGISEYRTNRNGVCPSGLIEMQSAPPHGEWTANGDGTYTEIDTEASAQEQITALESQQTARMLRQAALGDTDSIAMLQSIEDQIAELRIEL